MVPFVSHLSLFFFRSLSLCVPHTQSWDGTQHNKCKCIHTCTLGFTAMLVSIPRLMVYASILLAAKNIPDLATSQQGFEAIQLASFATLEGILLKAALAIMALSTVVHGLHLIRIVLAGAVCTFSLCYLGSMRKAMTIDLESRYVLFTVPMNAHEMKDSNLRTRPSRLGLLSCSSSYVYLTTLTPGPLACACITQQNHKSRRFNKLSRA